ncbi:MAG: hypothetical protein RL514_4629 [Verrucomicrobiota bacterium]|jgi:hypothetical protein
MTSTKDGAILKTDTKGRIRTPLARREQLLDEFERSGLSAAKFAELTGLKYQTFAGWVQRRCKQRSAAAPVVATAPAQLRWLEAVVDQAAGTEPAGLWVHLPGGARFAVTTPQQAVLAADLWRALA